MIMLPRLKENNLARDFFLPPRPTRTISQFRATGDALCCFVVAFIAVICIPFAIVWEPIEYSDLKNVCKSQPMSSWALRSHVKTSSVHIDMSNLQQLEGQCQWSDCFPQLLQAQKCSAVEDPYYITYVVQSGRGSSEFWELTPSTLLTFLTWLSQQHSQRLELRDISLYREDKTFIFSCSCTQHLKYNTSWSCKTVRNLCNLEMSTT